MPVSFYLVFDTPTGQQTSFSKHEATPTYRLCWKLLATFATLDVLLLAAGITFVALALTWWNPDPVRLMVLSNRDLFAGLALGTLFLATFLFTLPTLLRTLALKPRKPFRTAPFAYLNCVLAVDLMGVIAAGGIVWFRTLQERVTFFKFWEGDTQLQQVLMDKFNCCGYFDACPASESTPALPVCVDPITAYADHLLHALFTSMFAMSAIIVSLILCVACVIAELRVLERYRKIDIKRGTFTAVQC